MTIRAVFFDYGGVIQRTDYQAPRQRLAERFGMDYADIDEVVFGGGPNGTAAQATVGAIGEDEHWRAVARRLKVKNGEIENIKTAFYAGDVIDHELVDFIRSLRGKFHVGLISNAWDGMRAYLEKNGLLAVFDTVIISAEVKAAKPEAGIYRLALEQAQVKANEAVFVDDVPANIEACQQVGMQGVLFKDPQDAMRQLKQLLKF
ncbi:MAG: HAD family phosphatase [Anaerolineales bacterium]|nr:HAD family phosphatase [Anaerolineales bacterium]